MQSVARALAVMAVVGYAVAAPLQEKVALSNDNDAAAIPVAVTDPDQSHWADSAEMDGAPHNDQAGSEPAQEEEDAKTTLPPKVEDVTEPKGNSSEPKGNSSDTDAGENGGEDDPSGNSTNTGPCADACIPDIDVEASVIETYQRLRAQVAVIGDYGTCKPGMPGNFTWTVDWGDKEEYIHTQDTIGPYQAERVYSAKKKRKVKVSFCSENPEGCDEGCSSFYKHIHVRP